jgi:twitching motility two-component system response regulator PilH
MAHILIVDDSRTEVKFMKIILERKGYETSEAYNGEKGIEKAEALQPDLILMDIIMPGKFNGYQATRYLTNSPKTKSIPIVIVSTLNTPNDQAWGFMMGAVGYLPKPFKPKQLLESITRHLNINVKSSL